MENLTARKLSEYCAGRILCGDEPTAVTSVCVDSRKAVPGSLFVALSGAQTDGHLFIDMAVKNGAVCVLSQQEILREDCCVIVVENTLQALQAAASRYRRRFEIKCVGVTGSVGKTTTKEFIYSVLASVYNTHKTQGNLNSETGMPMSVFGLSSAHEAAVFEMGMSARGEIAALTKVAHPDIAVITNIGVSHIEHLGSRENILYAKLEIERGLSRHGVMVLCADDELLWGLGGKLRHKTVYYGVDNSIALYRAENFRTMDTYTVFDAVTPAGTLPVRINTIGVHNVRNAMAAITVGLYSGIDLEKCAASLLNFQNADMRQNIYGYNGITIIEDCYNASPDSMRAALSLLGTMNPRRVAVLADMLELGGFSKDMHLQIGRTAAENCDILLAFGDQGRYYCKGAAAAGMEKANVYNFGDGAAVARRLAKIIESGDTVLFKGSRGMRCELVLERFKKEWEK